MTGTGVTAMAQPRAERALPLPVMQRGVQRSEPRVSGQKSGVGEIAPIRKGFAGSRIHVQFPRTHTKKIKPSVTLATSALENRGEWISRAL